MTLPFPSAIWKEITASKPDLPGFFPTAYDHWPPKLLATHLKLNRSALVITTQHWPLINLLCIQLAWTKLCSPGPCNSCRTAVVSQFSGSVKQWSCSNFQGVSTAVMFICTSSSKKITLQFSLVYKMWSCVLWR